MSLPGFTDRGLLPEGIHECSLGELAEAFASSPNAWRRRSLFDRLVDYAGQLRSAGIGRELIINGSFVMVPVVEPNDVDVIVVLPPEWNVQGELSPTDYNLLWTRQVRKRFGLDAFGAASGSKAEADLLEFFGRVGPQWRHLFGWPPGMRKGLAKVRL